jgi:serine-type D-Ala-D-Ala carboxypeptidase/endopeptidase
MTKPILFFCFLMCLFSNTYAQDVSFLQSQIERAIAYENRYDSLKTTGLIIGCIDHDSIWMFPFGRISKSINKKPDAETYFEIGSLTQSFTAANIQFLVSQGILHYDSTVNTYLKKEQRFAAGYKITLLNLVTHTSGLPKYPDDWGDIQQDKEQPYAHYTEGSFFDFLKKHDTIPNTQEHQGKYLFSNLNYVLAGQILENMAEQDWWQLFPDKSTVPLAQGYNLAGQAVEPWQVAPIYQSAIGGSTNMTQLLGFTQWQLNIDSLDKKGLLRETQVPIFATKINKYTTVAKGWHIFKEKKRLPICMASGATGGHSAVIVFLPNTKTGVVILSNSRAIQGALAMSILKVLNNNWKRK